MRSTKPFCQDQSDYGSMISTPNDDITSTSPLNPLIPTNRQRWTSIIIVLVLQLLLVIQNSIYWNTLWPFMRTIDPSTDQTFYGTTLMLGSLATTLASPLLGYWSNRMQQCRLPVIFGVTVSIFGNLLIAMCESFSGDQKYVIMVGRLIAGNVPTHIYTHLDTPHTHTQTHKPIRTLTLHIQTYTPLMLKQHTETYIYTKTQTNTYTTT